LLRFSTHSYLENGFEGLVKQRLACDRLVDSSVINAIQNGGSNSRYRSGCQGLLSFIAPQSWVLQKLVHFKNKQDEVVK